MTAQPPAPQPEPADELVCEYCGQPEADCHAARDGRSITLVTPEQHRHYRETGEFA